MVAESNVGSKRRRDDCEESSRLVRGGFGMTRRSNNLGTLSSLPDDLLLTIWSFLSTADVCRLSPCSPFIYCLCDHEDLWKTLVLRNREHLNNFDETWRQTFLTEIGIAARHISLCFDGIFSDSLFQPWLNSSRGISRKWLCNENIDRRSVNELSKEMFIDEYERLNIPIIITDCVTQWPAFQKWNPEFLSKSFGNIPVNVQVVDMPMEAYWRYSNQTVDETPLYIFEKEFIKRVPDLAADFQVPPYFCDDLFELLGEHRPDYRWLVAGPARSGSTFHQDPNGTSAWNAVITGKKKWIMMPKEICPPGVQPSVDGSEVMTPLSIVEWFTSFYASTQSKDFPRPFEAIVNSGEMIFVPSGWWHCVLNLEPSIAVTQNFVSPRRLLNVLEFINDRRDQVSGYYSSMPLADKFQTLVEEAYPNLIQQLKDEKAAKTQSRLWSKCSSNSDSSPFSFGF